MISDSAGCSALLQSKLGNFVVFDVEGEEKKVPELTLNFADGRKLIGGHEFCHTATYSSHSSHHVPAAVAAESEGENSGVRRALANQFSDLILIGWLAVGEDEHISGCPILVR